MGVDAIRASYFRVYWKIKHPFEHTQFSNRYSHITIFVSVHNIKILILLHLFPIFGIQYTYVFRLSRLCVFSACILFYRFPYFSIFFCTHTHTRKNRLQRRKKTSKILGVYLGIYMFMYLQLYKKKCRI